MARRKISEHKAKSILFSALKIPYTGMSINTHSHFAINVSPQQLYTIKVDQGVKGRMKKGLVALRVNRQTIKEFIEKHREFHNFIIEEFVPHETNEERFIALERQREGLVIHYSEKGGIDIEKNKQSVKTVFFDQHTITQISNDLAIPKSFLKILLLVFEENYFSFLEINPLVVQNNALYILDLAVEVDDAAEFFVHNSWTRNDYVQAKNTITPEEQAIEVLGRQSQASLKLDVFNPNGSIFLLLSGGGASIAVADEVYNLGFGKKLVNYGEYSGNPNTEETYTYTKNLLSLLHKSTSPQKIIIIAGGVANFTDIRKTFQGLIQAFQEDIENLQKEKVQFFVRRGGPYQKEGLQLMKNFLDKNHIKNVVAGPEMVLTDIVNIALKKL